MIKSNGEIFQNSLNAITASKVKCESLNVNYESPSLGKMKFGLEDVLQIKEQAIATKNYLRYDNPFCHVAFNSRRISIISNKKMLVLDFEKTLTKRKLDKHLRKNKIGMKLSLYFNKK